MNAGDWAALPAEDGSRVVDADRDSPYCYQRYENIRLLGVILSASPADLVTTSVIQAQTIEALPFSIANLEHLLAALPTASSFFCP